MRYLVNGVEADLSPSSAVRVDDLGDRWAVHSEDGTATALAVRKGDTVYVSYKGRVFEVERPTRSRSRLKHHGTGECHAPMPGQIVEVFVEQGYQVHSGQKLLVLEAMKMQHTVTAPFAGVVSQVAVHKGDQVGEDQLLVSVELVDE